METTSIAPFMLAALLAISGVESGQTLRLRTPVFRRLPGIASPQLDALGTRVRMQGKELTVLTGEYLDASGQRRTAQIVHQLPNLVILRGFALGNRELKFDGNRQPAGLAPNEEALLELFVSDVVEGMLTSIQDGAAIRLLGREFKPGATVAPSYTGSGYDIFEVASRIPFGMTEKVRMKFYYFDSTSGLLLNTRYQDGSVVPAVRVETRFSDWRLVDGSAYPSRIERYENDRRVFSFTTTNISGAPAIAAANFR
jgi:hypothetical protein